LVLGSCCFGRLFKLLPERGDDLVLIEFQHAGILAHEIAGKHTARQTIELIGLDRFQQMHGDFGFRGYLFEVPTAAQTFPAERFAD